MADKEIMIYALTTCIWCKKTLEWFKHEKIRFQHVFVDDLPEEEHKKVMKTVLELNPIGNFPVVRIGESVIVGFKPEEFEKAFK